jgi:hypothetical protein
MSKWELNYAHVTQVEYEVFLGHAASESSGQSNNFGLDNYNTSVVIG